MSSLLTGIKRRKKMRIIPAIFNGIHKKIFFPWYPLRLLAFLTIDHPRWSEDMKFFNRIELHSNMPHIFFKYFFQCIELNSFKFWLQQHCKQTRFGPFVKVQLLSQFENILRISKNHRIHTVSIRVQRHAKSARSLCGFFSRFLFIHSYNIHVCFYFLLFRAYYSIAFSQIGDRRQFKQQLKCTN